jgi:hypothetical protein
MTLHPIRALIRCIALFCLITVAVLPSLAQVPVILAPTPRLQFFDASGNPLSFGCVFTYQVNTVTPLATFTDNTGVTQNANPVVLTAGGSASIWLQTGVAYTFKIASQGGLNCASGSTLYTVNGIGGGASSLTTIVPYSPTPTFQISAQNQLFQITLTGNASSQPLTAVGITPPGLVTWEITQDGAGGHTFSWPANSVGGCTIGGAALSTTLQHFIWDGVQAFATGPCVVGPGPTISAGNIFDFGLTPNLVTCVDSFHTITTSCGSLAAVTYNGQTATFGGSGNVNNGANPHSLALNEGNGNPLTGLTLGASQVPLGQSGADPSPVAVATTNTNQALGFNGANFITVPVTTIGAVSRTTLGGTTAIAGSPSTTNLITQAITMPSSGCPCRVLANWTLFMSTTNAGEFAIWVSDGSNVFATGSTATTGSSSHFSASASEMSPVTYGNGAVVTFTEVGSQDAGGTSNALVNSGVGAATEPSFLNLTVFQNAN